MLKNGSYDSVEPFYNSGGNRLWAQTLGGAVLHAGISMGGQWGPGGGLVRGITFDVTSPARTLENSIIHVWGTGKNSKIQDVTMDGHKAIGAGIMVREPEGAVIQRVVTTNFIDFGIIIDNQDQTATFTNRPLLEDADSAHVSRAVPKSSNGTSEACVWIGNTATVRRIRTSDCAWEGLWAGTGATGGLFEDLTLNNSETGAYLEHFVHQSTFRRMQVGPNTTTGVQCEWADPDWGSKPGCEGNVIESSYFDTRRVGVYLDEGTKTTTVHDTTFANQCWAAIGDYKGNGNLSNTSGNDYSRIKSGAVKIIYKHIYSAPC